MQYMNVYVWENEDKELAQVSYSLFIGATVRSGTWSRHQQLQQQEQQSFLQE